MVPAVMALLGAGLIQIGTNLANDYYDAIKGVDTADREGFTRVTHSGLLPAQSVRNGMIMTFTAAVITGIYLVWVGGIPILLVGILSIAAGILYTGGPYPFGYYGLGDVFVFIFFGLIAVTGTYYVQIVSFTHAFFPIWIPPGTIPQTVIIGSLPMAALITNILVVNNIRDIETDKAANKRTLAVLIGYTGSRVEFTALMVLAYSIPLYFFVMGYPLVVLLPLLSLPVAVTILRTVLRSTHATKLNNALTQTGQLTAVFAGLFAIGLIL
jgi:1,4-dihydroxy-2-naphthoate octaprenyltransferase